MRGAPRRALCAIPLERIIPADAGSTPVGRADPPDRPDHPRGCGEHMTYNWNSPFERGSSPRMRGARHMTILCYILSRIIPADAGSTM